MLRVMKDRGSPTRYFVESATLQCVRPECAATFRRRPHSYEDLPPVVALVLRMLGSTLPGSRSLAGLKVELDRLFARVRDRGCPKAGDKCPTCGQAELDVRFHTVDIAALGMNGECGCEYFQMSLRKQAAASSPVEQAAGRFRCQHIHAARDFALDVSLRSYERDRLGGREEAA